MISRSLAILTFLGCGYAVSAQDFSAFDAFLEANVDSSDDGYGWIVYQLHGERGAPGSTITEAFRKNYGGWTDDRRPPIASATKWFSGALVMDLVDDGFYTLDTPLYPLVPGLDDGEKRLVDVRMGFTHSHGFNQGVFPHWNARLPSMQAAAAIAARQPLESTPGTEVYYAGTGMQMVGSYSELITGSDWQSLFDERIGGPLGLTQTDYWAFSGVPVPNPTVEGSIQTTIEEHAAFAKMLLNYGRADDGAVVLSEEAVDEMLFAHTADLPIERSPYDLYEEFVPGISQIPTSMGGFVYEYDPLTHDGLVVFSGGAFGAHGFIDLKHGFAGSFMTETYSQRLDSEGVAYNPASRVFLEAYPLLQQAFAVPEPTTATLSLLGVPILVATHRHRREASGGP